MKSLLMIGRILFLSLFLTGLGNAAPLENGSAIPDLLVHDQDGNEYSLKKHSKGYLLVYFFPKTFTPGCTTQAKNLRNHFKSLQKFGVSVVGVSMDEPEMQKKFRDEYQIPFSLLGDVDGQVVKAFGVPSIRPGFCSRQSFLFRDGKLVWRDLKTEPKRQSEDVLAFIRSIAKK